MWGLLSGKKVGRRKKRGEFLAMKDGGRKSTGIRPGNQT